MANISKRNVLKDAIAGALAACGIRGEDTVTKIPKPLTERGKRLRWSWTIVLGLAAFVSIGIGRSVVVGAEGIEIRGGGCIGNCRDGACCKGWITLDPKGVGFARNFVCVDYMKTADAKERAWVCQQLRKKNDVCQEVAGFCADTPACSQPFKNCREAEEFIDRARADKSLSVAEADVRLKPTLGASKVSRLADGSFKAEVPVTWALDEEETTLVLPDWCWPSMTNAERTELRQFVDALKVHEDGHVKVATDFGKEVSNTQSAKGTTEADAMSKLQQQLYKYLEESSKELDRRTERYDEVTDHGAKQSSGPQFGFPGGRNAVLTCP